MRRNFYGLLTQFGFGINNDLLAAVIVFACLAASLGVLSLMGAL